MFPEFLHGFSSRPPRAAPEIAYIGNISKKFDIRTRGD
jgi:hypothetical protein